MNDHWRYFAKKVEMDLEIMHEKYFFFLFSFEILAWKFLAQLSTHHKFGTIWQTDFMQIIFIQNFIFIREAWESMMENELYMVNCIW